MKKFTPLIILLAAIMVISSSAMTVGAVTSQIKGLDYSNPSAPVSIEMGNVEFMKFLTGETISDIEAEYLESTVGDLFVYSNVIPQKYVETSYFAGTLSVTAKEYSYQTSDGATVKWVPGDAKIDGIKIDLSLSPEGDYKGEINDFEGSGENYLTVDYTCILELDAAVVDTYKNYTYNYAYGLWKENDEYNKNYVAYEAYQKYLLELNAYNELKAQWDTYNKAYNNWVAKEEAYNNYINVLLPAYEKAYAAWKTYDDAMKALPDQIKAYEAYLAADKQYKEVDLPAYQQYVVDVNTSLEKLDVMESIYLVGDTHGKQLYGTIMGNLVDGVMDSVETEYETLKAAGMKVSLDTIKETRTYTKKLRPLLEGYNTIRKKEQSAGDPITKMSYSAEKFNYYKDNYTTIRDCFNVITKNLSTMFQDNTIKNGLLNKKGEYYFRRYIQFVCQMYVVSTGLDNEIRNPDWNIKGEQTTPITVPATYVPYYWNGTWHGYLNDEAEHAIIDANLKPIDDGTISRDPSKNKKLDVGVIEPTAPIEIEDPRNDLPPEAAKPTEPDVVKEPGSRPTPPEKELGNPPVEVPFGGNIPPERVVYTAQQLSLINAIGNGTLKKRTEGKGATIELKTDLSRTVLLEDKCIVSFYDYDGKTLLDSYIVEIGENIVYNGAAPSRENTDKYIYAFEGWKDEDGKLVDELGVTVGNYMSFYASYSATVKTYNVTWIVDGETTTEAYEYGTTPEYKGELIKEETPQYKYIFKGWNKPVAVVKEDATYEAEFEPVLKQYTVEWHYGDEVYTENYNYGETPSFKQSTSDFIDEKYIYSFLKWDKDISEVNGNAVYTAEFNKTAIAEDAQGAAVEVTFGESGYSVSVSEETVYIENLLQLAWKNDCKIELSFEEAGAGLTLNEALVTDMIQSGCKKVYIYLNNEEKRAVSNTVKYTVRFVDGEDNDVSLEHGVAVKFKDNIKPSTRAYLVLEDGTESLTAYSYENGVLTLKLNESSVIAFKNEYKVTVGECENGSMIADLVYAEAGQTVTVTLWFTDDYSIDFIKVVGKETGKEYPVEGEGKFTFVMPDEEVTVSAKLDQKEYTVKFVVDGKVISEKVYHKGDIVEVPGNPTKAQEGDKAYVFVGWTPEITPVTGDRTYVAEFKETTVSVDDFGGDRGNFYLVLNILVVVAFVLIASTVVVIVVVSKKKKAKKKLESKDESDS